MTITMDKKYHYRNGGPARVLCVDGPGSGPVLSTDGCTIYFHRRDGSLIYGNTGKGDLIEVTPQAEGEIRRSASQAECAKPGAERGG